KKNARCRYTTIQNWSTNVFNLVTKRAMVYGDATMEWVDGNLGSQITMKYPSVYLMEPGAKGDVLSIAFAGKGQHQDARGKMSHGITRSEAETMIVNGFIEPFTKELPLEYAVELNRLIQLEMEGSVG